MAAEPVIHSDVSLRLSATSHGDETASPLFMMAFLEDVRFQSFLGVHLREPLAFIL